MLAIEESLRALERVQAKALNWIYDRKPYQTNFIECNLLPHLIHAVFEPPVIIEIDLSLLQSSLL